MEDNSFINLSRGDVKTLVVACVESGRENMLKSILGKLHNIGKLDSTLMYIALSHVMKRKDDVLWSYRLLCDTMQYQFPTDKDMLQQIIENLISKSYLQDALKLLEYAFQGKFGTFHGNYGASFLDSLVSASITKTNTSTLVQIARLVTNKNVIHHSRTSKSVQVLIQFLEVCTLRGDLASSITILSLYKRAFHDVQARAYALVLSCYLTWFTDIAVKEKLPLQSGEKIPLYQAQMDALVGKIIMKDIDRDPVVSNLLLRYICAQDDVKAARYYLHRLHRFKNTMTTLTLVKIASLAMKSQYPVLTTTEIQYVINQQNLFPLQDIRQHNILTEK